MKERTLRMDVTETGSPGRLSFGAGCLNRRCHRCDIIISKVIPSHVASSTKATGSMIVTFLIT